MTAYILLITLLLAGAAFFAANEIAVTMASRVRLRTQAEAGSRRARFAERLLRYPDRAIVTCLVGSNLMSVAVALVGQLAVLAILDVGEATADVIATAIILPLLLVFGEVVPKALSQTYPNRILSFFAPAFTIVRILLWPLAVVCFGIVDLVRRLLGVRAGVRDLVTREEFKQLMAQSEKGGHVDENERALIDRIVEFGGLDPARIARPLAAVPCVPETATAASAKELMRREHLGRMAVTNAAGTSVVGVVSASGLLDVPNDAPLAAYLLPPVYVRTGAGSDRLLAELQRSPAQIAILSREDGGTGIITLDDLLTHLLGSVAPPRRHWLRSQVA